ncbi:MAG: hypothetical protein EA424_06400 [Planctomycetaceae bacterium]|nr:MAG: hypothetical protein EA424_06400 [Planctomycetaceae bacterium]
MVVEKSASLEKDHRWPPHFWVWMPQALSKDRDRPRVGIEGVQCCLTDPPGRSVRGNHGSPVR